MIRHLKYALIASLFVPAYASARTVNIQVREAEVVEVLRMLGEIGRVNLAIDDDVHGKVTLALENVTWKLAMRVVLKSKGLGVERIGNVLRIAPLERLLSEKQTRVSAKELELDARPLETRFIAVNYARADDLVEFVRQTLTRRGKATVDARTNTIIVTDVVPRAAE